MVAIRTQDFFARVLPLDGERYWYGTVTAGPKGGRWNQTPADDIHALITGVNKLRDAGKNTYFATASYTPGGDRLKSAVALKKCYYVDIDSGPGKPYETVKDALEGVKAFVRLKIVPPPSIIVCSGNGIHLYWTLRDPVTRAEWEPVATALQAICVANELHTDSKITADATRVLRVPGSINTKDGRPPSTCTMLRDSGIDYTQAEMARRLCSHAADDNDDNDDGPAPRAPGPAGTGAAAIDQPWGGAVNNSAPVAPHPLKYATPIFNRCGVMSHAREIQGAEQPGTLWHKILHVLAYTEDGVHFIDDVSRGHDEYDARKTRTRFNYSVAQRAAGKGPTLCATFATDCPSICQACPHFGKIKTPAQLGDVTKLDLPDGYFQTARGLFYKQPPKKEDDESKVIFIMPYNMIDLRVAKDLELGDQIFQRTNAPSQSGDERETSYGFKALSGDSAALCDALGRAGQLFNPHELKHYKEFIVAWVRKLQQAGSVQKMIRHFGWVQSGKRGGFAAGDHVFWDDGSCDTTMRTDDALTRQYFAMGSREPWQAACDLVVAQGRQEFNAVIASAFAAPLMQFVGVHGALLSIVSRESGTGKSTALQIAQGVWGSPQEGINALNDTPNSVVRKLGTLKNLPAYWDELRMKEDVRNFVKLVFQLAQGKEKSRLTSSSTMHSMGTWSTLITVASNEPILDHVAQIVHGSDAGVARVFELTCGAAPPTSTSLSDAMSVFNKLKNNYGHAGLVYAQYLAENAHAVEQLVESNRDKLSKALNVTSAERFRLSIVTALITGAQLAKKLGLVQFDMPALTKFLLAEFRSLGVRGQEEMAADSAVTRLQEYINTFADSKLVTKSSLSLGAPGRHTGTTVTEIPKKLPLRFRIHEAPTEVAIAIDATHFGAWAYEKYQLMKSNIRDELGKHGVTLQPLAMAAGTSYGLGKTACFLVTSTSAAGIALGLDETAVVEPESPAS